MGAAYAHKFLKVEAKRQQMKANDRAKFDKQNAAELEKLAAIGLRSSLIKVKPKDY